MRRPALLLAVALLIIPVCLISYRILWLEYPLLPTAPGKAWELSMDAHVKGEKDEMTLLIGLPFTREEQIVIEEKITSGPLNFNLLRQGANQVGIWSGGTGPDGEIVRYRAILLVRSKPASKSPPPILEPYPYTIDKEIQVLAERLASKWKDLEPSGRLRVIAGALSNTWRDPAPEDQDIQAWSRFQEKEGKVMAWRVLLRASGLPARVLSGLHLVESVATKPFTWIEVWTGENWERLLPETGEIFKKSVSLLPLATGEMPAVTISNGELSDMRWVLNQEIVSRWRMHFERITRSDRFLDRWSLFRLPQDFQESFRILLLVPIGALMICVLRNLVGFPTFGIFMPVLMALAFRSTGLLYGLGIFAGVVFIGYGVRRWVDKLRLLLVPRLSLILTLVITCFTGFALLGNKFGLRELMAVGLLPFVILTMTIERFFVIVEESGLREGFRTAAGSAAVAVITHEILHLEFLQLTFFVYPELLFAVAGLQVLLGRYTGYRVSELIRFRRFRSSS
jgi:hypothetical protein